MSQIKNGKKSPKSDDCRKIDRIINLDFQEFPL
ncbi:hypothetical protein NIES298_44000 [Microcystis aeruginosa NIES-298]|nr:hypothetical protein NIES298_44000 [Microcystis aeruginosa NIES-298]